MKLFFVRFFFFSSRRRHTRFDCDWSSDVCSSDLAWPGASGSSRAAPQRLPTRLTDVCRRLRPPPVRYGLGVASGCAPCSLPWTDSRSEEHTSELQSQSNLVCRLLLEKKKNSREPS